MGLKRLIDLAVMTPESLSITNLVKWDVTPINNDGRDLVGHPVVSRQLCLYILNLHSRNQARRVDLTVNPRYIQTPPLAIQSLNAQTWAERVKRLFCPYLVVVTLAESATYIQILRKSIVMKISSCEHFYPEGEPRQKILLEPARSIRDFPQHDVLAGCFSILAEK